MGYLKHSGVCVFPSHNGYTHLCGDFFGVWITGKYFGTCNPKIVGEYSIEEKEMATRAWRKKFPHLSLNTKYVKIGICRDCLTKFRNRTKRYPKDSDILRDDLDELRRVAEEERKREEEEEEAEDVEEGAEDVVEVDVDAVEDEAEDGSVADSEEWKGAPSNVSTQTDSPMASKTTQTVGSYHLIPLKKRPRVDVSTPVKRTKLIEE